MTAPDTPQNPSSAQGTTYAKFFESHGVRVVDSELAEEATRMAQDEYSLFDMWRFTGSKDSLSEVPDMPRCATSLEFEAVQPGPERAHTLDQIPEELHHEMETSYVHSPTFTMAGYMVRMQEARVTANLVKEATGLDVYKREDFLKVKHLVENEEDPYLTRIIGHPRTRQGGALFVTSETYKTLQGSEDLPETGAWFDAPLYPDEVRKDWINRGSFDAWETTPARLLDPKVMYGEKLGSALHQWHIGNVMKTMAWDKTKIASKMIGFGMGLWLVTIVLAKRYQLQYRDHITAQLVFAERLNSLDDYYPATEANVHKQLQLRGYLENYFEEDDDDEL